MEKQKMKITKRFAQQVRDYLISNLCVMNGLRASNIIHLTMSDVFDAHKAEKYPGYMVFINSNYKTSTIYGEKVIVLPDNVFRHIQLLKCFGQLLAVQRRAICLLLWILLRCHMVLLEVH